MAPVAPKKGKKDFGDILGSHGRLKARLSRWKAYFSAYPERWDALARDAIYREDLSLPRSLEQAESLLAKAEGKIRFAILGGESGFRGCAAWVYWATFGCREARGLLDTLESFDQALERVCSPHTKSRSPPTHPVICQTWDTGIPPVHVHPKAPMPILDVVRHLRNHAREAIKKVQSCDTDQDFDAVTDRLERWGKELYGPLALELLFSAQAMEDMPWDNLKKVTTTTMVDMILVLEFLLVQLSEVTSRPDLEQSLAELALSFPAEEDTELATTPPMPVRENADTDNRLLRGKHELDCILKDLACLLPTIRIPRIRMLQKGAMIDRLSNQREDARMRLIKATQMRGI
ncbi:hypothetical protein F4780DRAFT_83057 [Xylariomycetidae sp. FL0641]|nr:hypothetical protein F4780DRAFT_83057 [Xylariomycetidae sp. FL0641]